MSAFTAPPEDNARRSRIRRTHALLGDLDLIASSPHAAFPCRSQVPLPIAHFFLLARVDPVPWLKIKPALAAEFSPARMPVVYGSPLGLGMIVELLRRCTALDLEQGIEVERLL